MKTSKFNTNPSLSKLTLTSKMAAPTALLLHLLLISTLLLLHFTAAISSTTSPDTNMLLQFKATADRTNKLTTWNTTTNSNSCTWPGVTCLKTNNRVSRLVLENLDLHGTIAPVTSLTRLRVLSLKNNSLFGPVPDVSNLTSLKLLFLSHNNFSGEFPASVSSLSRLFRLDISFNNFSGEFAVMGFSMLTHLLTLRLEENRFTGSISGLNVPALRDFNVSGNRLSGEIPVSLSVYPESVFEKNPDLCGKPMKSCNDIGSNPSNPGSGSNVVSSTPSSKPLTAPDQLKPINNGRNRGKISTLALVCIIAGDVLVLIIISLCLYCYFWRNYALRLRDGKSSTEAEKIVYSSSPYQNQPGFERGRMVFFEGVKRFELEDLLRASAEMLGKGGFGTAYKAVLDDGNVVAVKRLKDANVGGKREFEQQMEVLGRLRHPNLVSLRAYYFAREEKLLVYDYMPDGSLFWLLHGNRGPGRVPLDWTTRLKIAAGAARGLAFIHTSCKALKLTHGNIKSTNILLDKAGNARVSDFGLFLFASSGTVPKHNGYRALELASSDGRNVTQKSDVYAFGVLLLEILTGKCPSVIDCGGVGGIGANGGAVDLPRWVQSVVREEWTAEVFDLELMRYKDIEEEMVGLLQIAMACTSLAPDQRPKMSHVVKMIDEIRGVEVSPPHESIDSVSESPCLSEDTCGASH